jgi:hypothetical protein
MRSYCKAYCSAADEKSLVHTWDWTAVCTEAAGIQSVEKKSFAVGRMEEGQLTPFEKRSEV